jgi:hypothetical protein
MMERNMSHTLDLTRYAWVKQKGDITIYGTWFGPSISESEPCLVLVPTYRRTNHETVRPCVVALSSAYKYDDPRYLLNAAMRLTQFLGLTDSMQSTMKVADAIFDHLDDLVHLPERPSYGQAVGADAVITDDQGRSFEFEILEHH